MIERKYSVQEIDALRSAVKCKLSFGTYNYPTKSGWGQPWKAGELERVAEEYVRTHMLAGHTAEDLLNSEKAP